MDRLLVGGHRAQVSAFHEGHPCRGGHEGEVVLEPAVDVLLDADLDVCRLEELFDSPGTFPGRPVELADEELTVMASGLLPVHEHEVGTVPATARAGEPEQDALLGQMVQVVVETGHVVAQEEDVLQMLVASQHRADGQAAGLRHGHHHQVVAILRGQPVHQLHLGDEPLAGEPVDDLDAVLPE